MKLTFRDKKLEKLAEDESKCIQKLGSRRAALFLRRLSELDAAENLEQVRNLPGHYHELLGDRAGTWACNLDHPYRLIFTPHEHPIPVDESGRTQWLAIEGVEILTIDDYH